MDDYTLLGRIRFLFNPSGSGYNVKPLVFCVCYCSYECENFMRQSRNFPLSYLGKLGICTLIANLFSIPRAIHRNSGNHCWLAELAAAAAAASDVILLMAA